LPARSASSECRSIASLRFALAHERQLARIEIVGKQVVSLVMPAAGDARAGERTDRHVQAVGVEPDDVADAEPPSSDDCRLFLGGRYGFRLA